MKQRPTRIRLIALGAVAVLGLAACGGDDSASEDTVADEATEEAVEEAASGTGNDCTAGKTLAEGQLTIATGNPAY